METSIKSELTKEQKQEEAERDMNYALALDKTFQEFDPVPEAFRKRFHSEVSKEEPTESVSIKDGKKEAPVTDYDSVLAYRQNELNIFKNMLDATKISNPSWKLLKQNLYIHAIKERTLDPAIMGHIRLNCIPWVARDEPLDPYFTIFDVPHGHIVERKDNGCIMWSSFWSVSGMGKVMHTSNFTKEGHFILTLVNELPGGILTDEGEFIKKLFDYMKQYEMYPVWDKIE